MSNEIIDLDEFMERVQDDKELLLELLDIYVEDYQTKRVSLGGAIENSNFEEVRNIAHSLKGASGNISAKPIRDHMAVLEDMGKGADLAKAKEILSAVDEEYVSLESQIKVLKETLS